MRSTRRGLLALAAGLPAAVLAACSPSPIVTGGPSAPFSPTPTGPVQSPGAARAADWTTRLRALVGTAPAQDADWAAAVTAQADAHLVRLDAADPLVPDAEPVFTPSPAPAPTTAPFEDALAALLAEGADLFGELVTDAQSQPERLLHASLAAAAAGLRNRALAPVPGEGTPIRFPETSLDGSLLVALSHVWALLHGLEVGLGRLPEGDVHDAARRRLAEAREQRNHLRAAVDGDSPEQEVAYEMPNPMTTPEEITDALAVLEQGLLDALARLVATGTEGTDWLQEMLQQVPQVQAWGGRLPHWPGWAQV
ncbi:DUF4439 domain-containing protein [Tessaracoccus rhinocerotis]|nr:DUF4439 domain-containing protein [Tessaracoccus rhinocerotis]